MKKNATNISWLNIICSFLNSLVGLNMITSMLILADKFNADELPTPSKISVYVGAITSILIGNGIVLKSSKSMWNQLETKTRSNLEEDIEQSTEVEQGFSKIKK